MKKLIVAIILLALLTGCAQSSVKPTPTPTATAKKAGASGASAQGYVTPVQRADLAFRSSGRVAQVLVKEGDSVQAGQPLVKLQDAELKAGLLQAQADLAQLQAGARLEQIAASQANLDIAQHQLELAEADLSRLQNGTLATQLASAQADAAQAAAELKVAQDAYDFLTTGRGIANDQASAQRTLGYQEEIKRIQLAATRATFEAAQKRLTQVQASRGLDLQAVQAQVEIAKGRRDAAQAQLDLLKAGSTAEQIDGAKARVAQAQAALDEATLLAPFNGTLAELDINPGELVVPGARIASIADLSNWQVDTDDLSEVDVVNVQTGADVSITVDALPGVTLKGKVTSTTPRSAVKRGDVTYTVKVAITDPDSRLKWGMTAFVDIQAK